MPTTPNMGLVLPDEDGSANVWDTILNLLLGGGGGGVDGHDHTAGKGVKVPSAGLNINADVPWSSGGIQYAITQIKALDFTPNASSGMTGYAAALFVDSADNELYWRTQGGTNVKLTSGTSLNASVIGGIGGDYASIGALIDYVDASDTYRMRQQLLSAKRQYARLQVGDLDVFEYLAAESASAVPTNRVRIKSPAALGASYDLTLPTAQSPANGTLIQCTTAGALSFSNAGIAASTFSGLITANSGVTLASNQNITLAGTGEIKHGTRTIERSLYAGVGTMALNAGAQFIVASAGGQIWQFPLGLAYGDRILSATFYFQRAGGTITFTLGKKTLATGVDAAVASTTVNSGTTYTTAVLAAINYTLVTTEGYFFQLTSGANLDQFHTCVLTYDHP